MLTKRKRKGTNYKQYALVSKSGSKVLKYFGKRKPSKKRVLKEERRVRYYKNLKK